MAAALISAQLALIAVLLLPILEAVKDKKK